MEIDFHFAVTYAVGRLAGLDHEKAQIVATCSQYVDDTINKGVLKFKSGEAYDRISTAHKKNDYNIALFVAERKTWVPFHFLPGNNSQDSPDQVFFNKIVCKPHSDVAKEMVRNCILKRGRPFEYHQLGITAHVFMDTWAHQGFAGVKHRVNVATSITLISPQEEHSFWKVIKHVGFFGAVWQFFQPTVCKLLNKFFPMGHGAVLHYPDHPFRKWSYKNGHGETIQRDNPKDFLVAADELCKCIRRFISGDPDKAVEGLPTNDLQIIRQKIGELTMNNGKIRNEKWLEAIRGGEFSFGKADPFYISSGNASWKYEALKTSRSRFWPWDRFEFQQTFVKSNYKLFHDAAQAHQNEILHEVLPRFGIIAI